MSIRSIVRVRMRVGVEEVLRIYRDQKQRKTEKESKRR